VPRELGLIATGAWANSVVGGGLAQAPARRFSVTPEPPHKWLILNM
jgi:hypothetical protein